MAEVEKLIELYQQLEDAGLMVVAGKKDSAELMVSRDVVPVVRCKDCKHWKPSGSMAGNSEDDLQPIGGCEWANCCRRANDFCSYGERKDNG